MINDNSQSSLNATQDDYEINLAEIFSIIWKRKAFIVALTKFKIFFDPCLFVRILLIPTCSSTNRTEAPAIIPVPGEAGLRKILLDPCFPIIV